MSRKHDLGSETANLLKAILFRLSNNLDFFHVSPFQSSHVSCIIRDRFFVQLVLEISKGNSKTLRDLLHNPCTTACAIKEALYGAAIREEAYELIGKLLEVGVSPDIPVWNKILRIRGGWRRGRACISLNVTSDNLPQCALRIAAIKCDLRLGKILIESNAKICVHYTHLLEDVANSRNHTAALEFAALLLEHGVKVDRPTSTEKNYNDGPSALSFAIGRGNNRLAEYLLEKGADTKCRERTLPLTSWQDASLDLCGGYYSPLQMAIVSNNAQMTDRLLCQLLDIENTGSLPCRRRILLTACLAGDSSTAMKLLDSGIDSVKEWDFGFTPLVASAWNPDLEIAESLLRRANPLLAETSYHTDGTSICALHVAAFHKNAQLVRRLINHGADCNLPVKTSFDRGNRFLPGTNSLWTPLELALESRDSETATALVRSSSNFVGGELVKAIRFGDKDLISTMISKGADIFAENDGRTSLDAAARRHHCRFISYYFSMGGTYRSVALYEAAHVAVTSNRDDAIQLLAARRPPGPIDSYEASAVVLAIQHRRESLLDLLLSANFVPSSAHSFCKDGKVLYFRPEHFRCMCPSLKGRGDTPFLAAMRSEDTSIVQRMFDLGYEPHSCDYSQFMLDQKTECRIQKAIGTSIRTRFPLENLDLTLRQELLLKAIRTNNIEVVRDCINLVESCDFSAKWFGDDWTPLQTALDTMRMDVELIRLIIKAGADTNALVTDDLCKRGLQQAMELKDFAVARLLIDAGAAINEPADDEERATALQWAAIHGSFDMLTYLIQKGADVNAAPSRSHGRTTLEGAAEHGRIDIVHFLLENDADVHVDVRGEKRIHYIRAVKFAEQEGHVSLAQHLRKIGGWTQRDREVYRRQNLTEGNIHFVYDDEAQDWYFEELEKRSIFAGLHVRSNTSPDSEYDSKDVSEDHGSQLEHQNSGILDAEESGSTNGSNDALETQGLPGTTESSSWTMSDFFDFDLYQSEMIECIEDQ